MRIRLESTAALSVPTIELDGPRAGVLATRLAQLMGLHERPQGVRVDRALVGSVITAAARAGLAEDLAARHDAAEPSDETTLAFLEALRQSPRPAAEVSQLAEILGYASLGQMVGASEPSLRRYASGLRQTPDRIALRLHFVTQIVAILRGSFNEFGIRRWFERAHPALDGLAPATVLRGDFDPADPSAQATLDAAARLLW